MKTECVLAFALLYCTATPHLFLLSFRQIRLRFRSVFIFLDLLSPLEEVHLYARSGMLFPTSTEGKKKNKTKEKGIG